MAKGAGRSAGEGLKVSNDILNGDSEGKTIGTAERILITTDTGRDGFLKAGAVDETIGKSEKTPITREKGRVSEEQVEKVIKGGGAFRG